MPFNINKHTTLTTDASENSIGAILSQEGHPVMYLSRRLTSAERNYSNIEREALAVVWATLRARNFLLGSHFTLNCDHQPLEFIFNPNRALPKVTSARILRWAIQLMAFDYEIHYVKGENIPHVDALSRMQFSDLTDDCEETKDESFIHWTETDVISMQQLNDETDNDRILYAIKKRIRDNRWSNCSSAERPYKSLKNCLTIEQGVIFKEDLIVVPQTLRKKFMSALHDDTHLGATATKNKAKLECWWPGFSNDIEQYIKLCNKCAEVKPIQNKFTHQWPNEDEPWSRVHMDHGFIQGQGLILILVDAFSGWPEVISVKNKESATILHILQIIFARNGVPKTLVSDNAAEFCDTNLHKWLDKVGCKMLKTPPYHPQSNGAAERMVQTIKNGLKAYRPERGTFSAFLSRFLLSYRTIPHGNRTLSPSALMGRQIRSPLTMSYECDAPLWYQAKPGAKAEKAFFVVQQGMNTAIIKKIRGQFLLIKINFDYVLKKIIKQHKNK